MGLRTTRTWLLVACLGLTVGLEAVLKGGVAPRYAFVGAVPLLLAGCMWIWSRADIPLSRLARWGIGLFVAVLVAQVIPLPPSLLEFLSPARASVLAGRGVKVGIEAFACCLGPTALQSIP